MVDNVENEDDVAYNLVFDGSNFHNHSFDVD